MTIYLKQIKIGNEKYPVHFGMNAITRIQDALGKPADDLGAGLNFSTAVERIKVAHVGFLEGQRIAKTDNVPDTFEGFCDLLDQRPEALSEAIGVYYLQTFGWAVEDFLKHAESNDPEVQKHIDNLKNIWPTLTKSASLLPSAEYTK